MPRKAREKSVTGIYHIVIRGIDRQLIFEERTDYKKYLDIVELNKDECGFKVYAYCLMPNHIHMIIKEADTCLDTIFRKINTHYAVWFNMKYQRTGPLQQGRYHSEPINDERYLLTAIRYVHRNPCKAGMENAPGTTYLWSSIYEYMSGRAHLIDMDLILSGMERKEFLSFQRIENEDHFLDVEDFIHRLPDDVAKEIMIKMTGCLNSSDFQKLSLIDRNKNIRILHENGVSVRQINRLTGTSRGVVNKIVTRGHSC